MVLDINPEEVDVVISAIHPDLSFLEAWRPFLSPYHLIIVQDPELEQNVEIPSGFDHTLYTKHDMERILGSGVLSSLGFRGHSCRSFGYLVSKKSTFFHYMMTAFLLRIQIRKLEEKNTQYVDAVMTVPNGALFPMSGINIAFDREIIGPAMFSGLGSSRSGKTALSWHSTLEDIWCGFCCKIICDHLRYGIKTGLPYVWRKELGDPVANLEGDAKGAQWLEEGVPFSKQFACLALPSLWKIALWKSVNKSRRTSRMQILSLGKLAP
eukprot:PITA_08658